MSARREKRNGKPTGRWYFRKQVTHAGKTERLFGVPEDYGQPNTKAGAEEAERIALARFRERGTIEAPTPVPEAPRAPTLREFVDKWLAKSRADDKPSTHKMKRWVAAKQLIPTFGHLPLDQITFSAVDTWRLKLLETIEPSSAARLLSSLRSLLGLALEYDLIAKIPKWPKQKVPESAPAFLTFDETARIIAAASPMDPWKAMVIVAVRTGLRHGELTALRWQDIDFDGRKLSVVENFVNGITGTPKSGKGRVIPLSDDALKALRAIQHKRGPLVFCTRTGGHLRYDITENALKLICRHAGMLPFGWHRFRHTFASHLTIRGVSLKVVQELMGHANIKMTLRYAHLSPETRHDAVMLLDAPERTPRSRTAARPSRGG